MSNLTFMPGTVTKVIDPVTYQIEVDVPGYIEGLKCFPWRGELDEPKEGDLVLIQELDADYHSYALWRKLKEDQFIGFRSNGKMIDITPDAITIGVFDKSKKYKDTEKPEMKTSIKITGEGKIEITGGGDITIKSSNVTVTGGKLTVKGQSNNSSDGPFNCLPVCPFSGAPHSGSMVSGT